MSKGDSKGNRTVAHAGDVLLWTQREPVEKRLFTVIAATHSETALLRLLSDISTVPDSLKRLYEIKRRIKWKQAVVAAWPLYADLSHLIVKKNEDITIAIERNALSTVGALVVQDVENIFERLEAEKTISREQKQKFLP